MRRYDRQARDRQEWAHEDGKTFQSTALLVQAILTYACIDVERHKLLVAQRINVSNIWRKWPFTEERLLPGSYVCLPFYHEIHSRYRPLQKWATRRQLPSGTVWVHQDFCRILVLPFSPRQCFLWDQWRWPTVAVTFRRDMVRKWNMIGVVYPNLRRGAWLGFARLIGPNTWVLVTYDVMSPVPENLY